jgi:hypothetical protein
MMFELLLDVTDRFLDLRNTNADSNHRIDAHTCTSHTVPLGWRFPRHFVPGYIMLSLRDKSHSPIEAAHLLRTRLLECFGELLAKFCGIRLPIC